MSSGTVETRLQNLEAQVARLQGELHDLKTRRGKDWRRTIGAFTGDEDMQALLQEAMRLREEDRKKARSKQSNSRKKS